MSAESRFGERPQFYIQREDDLLVFAPGGGEVSYFNKKLKSVNQDFWLLALSSSSIKVLIFCINVCAFSMYGIICSSVVSIKQL